MSEREQWGPWNLWCPINALAMPDDVQRGDLVEVDGVVRANKIKECRKFGFDLVHKSQRFVVGTGESFILDYPNPSATHVVTRYRVRRLCSEVELERSTEKRLPE